MDFEQAKTEAVGLVGSTVASLLTDDDWERAAARSKTFDDEGRIPGQIGYVDSYDPAWMAADAVYLHAIQQYSQDRTKRLTTSDGDTIEVVLGDLYTLARELRRRSPLYALAQAGSAGLVEIRIPSALSHFKPTSHGRL